MLEEIHLGVRPGRPTALLLGTAMILACMLGLAWLQVSRLHVLAPPLRIDDTPLLVRLPKDWVEDRRQPGVFEPPAAEKIRGAPVERYIRFTFHRLPAFQPPLEIIQDLAGRRSIKVLDIKPARIGRFDAAQVHWLIPFQFRGHRFAQQAVLRVACSPRGDVIMLEYLPLSDMTDADWNLLDVVCAAVRLDDPAFGVEPEAALRHVGVRFPLPDEWSVVGPEIAEVPGLYIGGLANGKPAWALGMFRTWLALGRTPRDLLTDFAEAIWKLPAAQVNIEEWARPDGTAVARLTPAGRDVPAYAANVWFVGQGAADAVLIFVQAAPKENAEEADAVVSEMVNSLAFEPPARNVTPETAETAGRELADLLTRAGAAPWWGRDPLHLHYQSQSGRDTEHWFMGRAAIDQNPKLGFKGSARLLYENREQVHKWGLDGRALGYTYSLKGYYGEGRNPPPIAVEERRAPESETVSRVVTLNRRKLPGRSFMVGPAFVSPPTESIAEAWVARQTEGTWLIQVSTVLGTGAHTRRLIPLGVDEANRPRVLRQDDYFPTGIVEGFQDNEVAYWTDGVRRFERIKTDGRGQSPRDEAKFRTTVEKINAAIGAE